MSTTASLHPAATQSSAETIAQFQKYVIPNYTRYPVSLVHGEGSYVWDAEGKRYLDLFPGWGCDIIGHSPPRVVQALQEQVKHLVHIPNTWYTEPQGKFAEAEREFSRVQRDMYVVARQLWSQHFPGKVIPPDDDAGRAATIRLVIAKIGERKLAAP